MKLTHLPQLFLLGTLLTLPATVPTSAQTEPTATAPRSTGTISGQIYNPLLGEYVRNAVIRIEGTGQTTTSGDSGRYRLTGVPTGSHTVIVTYTGYRTETATVSVNGDQTATRNFELRGSDFGDSDDEVLVLGEFLVSAEREGMSKAIMDQRRSMNITNTVSSDVFGEDGEGNLGEFLQFLPGVSMEDDFGEPRNIGLRGLGSQYTAVTINGMAIGSADPTAQSSVNSRAFSFENASLSSMDSIEIAKTTSANQDANAPAGTVNLRTKRAFDRPGQRIVAQLNLAAHSTDLTLGESQGPGEGESHRTRPGGIFEYSNSFFDNRFGVVLNVSDSTIYQEADIVGLTFDRNSTATDPRPVTISQMVFNQSVRLNERFASTLNMDLKATDHLILSLNTLYNWSELWNPQRRVLLTTGARRTVVGEDPLTEFSTTASNTVVGGRPTNIAKVSKTLTLLPKFEYQRERLTIEGRGVFSQADTWYDPLGRQGSVHSINNPSLVGSRYTASRDSANAYDWTITQTSGGDWSEGYNRVQPAIMDDHRRSANNIYGGELLGKYELEIADMPFELQAGLKTQYQYYNYRTSLNTSLYNYTPNGTNVGFNDFESTYAHDLALMNTTITSISGGGVFMPDLQAIGRRFLEHPEEFTHTVSTSQWKAVNITGPREYEETVDAAYIMATGNRGKSTYRAGLRLERTEGDAPTFNQRTDDEVIAAGYTLGSDGDATTIDGLAYQYLSLPERHRRESYTNLFPSASYRYSFSPNLIFSLGYSRTIRRPAFKDVAGVITINDDTLRVVAPNIDLEPEHSDNLSARLAYYFEPVGVLAVNAFMNNVDNLMIDNELTEDQFGYDGPEDLTGYTFVTTTNSANETKIRGLEIEYSQSLSFLPGPLSGLGIRAAYTYSDANAIVPDMVPHIVNGGISYSWRRFSMSVNALWRDDIPKNDLGNYYKRHRSTISANVRYKLSKNLSVFATGRNLGDSRDVYFDHYEGEPRTWRSYARYGTTFTAGLKGTF